MIIKDMDAIKKEYGRKRRTAIENAEEAVYEEKKMEEDGSLLPDGSLWLYEAYR